MAIATPMVPAPTMPTVLTFAVTDPSRLPTRQTRSADAAYCIARACAELLHFSPSSASLSRASWRLDESPYCTASTANLGAIWPPERRSIEVRQAAKKSTLTIGRAVFTRVALLADPGALRATCCLASATTSAATSASISPQSNASAAPIERPEVIILSARSAPISCGRRRVPPALGSNPNATSGKPSSVPPTATRAEQAIANSNPPPWTLPCSAATVVFG